MLAANNLTAADVESAAGLKRHASRQRLNDLIKTLRYVGIMDSNIAAVGQMLRRCIEKHAVYR